MKLRRDQYDRLIVSYDEERDRWFFRAFYGQKVMASFESPAWFDQAWSDRDLLDIAFTTLNKSDLNPTDNAKVEIWR